VVDRRDIQEHRIQVYTNDYDTPELGTGITNTTEVDDVLLNAATEDLKQYENLTGPHTRTYAPIRSIECDGLVKQVQYMCGLSTIGQTIVSVGQEDDLSLPTAVQSRRNELQKEFSTSGIKGDVNKGFVLAKIKNGNAEVG